MLTENPGMPRARAETGLGATIWARMPNGASRFDNIRDNIPRELGANGGGRTQKRGSLSGPRRAPRNPTRPRLTPPWELENRRAERRLQGRVLCPPLSYGADLKWFLGG